MEKPFRTIESAGYKQKLFDLQELVKYRDLLRFLVWRDINVIYKQTVLGFLWAVARPLVTMVVFSVIFGGLANIPSDGKPYPLFSFAALVPWTYFASAMQNSTTSLIASAGVVGKVYFPRLFIPLTPVLARLVDFFIALAIMFLMMAWYGIWPTYNIFYMPILMIIMILTAFGIGAWLCAMSLQYRDVAIAVSFLAQIMMYAAPVVWPLALIPEKYQFIYGFYPMAGVIEGMRAALLGTRAMPWDYIIQGSIVALFLAVSGAWYFRRQEGKFADVA